MNFCSEISAAMERLDALNKAMRECPKSQTRWDRKCAFERKCELRIDAAREFAKLNGWRFSKTPFGSGMLARSTDIYDRWAYDGKLFDHAAYFRETQRPYRPVAMVGQPYRHNDVEYARKRAEQMGLELHTPPIITASWWFPGATFFFVFVRPGTAVKFLPDQIDEAC